VREAQNEWKRERKPAMPFTSDSIEHEIDAEGVGMY
jgi:hypothetical protein